MSSMLLQVTDKFYSNIYLRPFTVHDIFCLIFFATVIPPFFQHDDAAINLMEMRFHIPASELAGDDPVENFQQRVMAKASVITATGDALAIFREVQCLTPRYVQPKFIVGNRSHGKYG